MWTLCRHFCSCNDFGTMGMGRLFFVSTSLNPIDSFIHETPHSNWYDLNDMTWRDVMKSSILTRKPCHKKIQNCMCVLPLSSFSTFERVGHPPRMMNMLPAVDLAITGFLGIHYRRIRSIIEQECQINPVKVPRKIASHSPLFRRESLRRTCRDWVFKICHDN
jgi:hypothetical protein